MRLSHWLFAFVAVFALASPSAAFHGGTYSGPGTPVPAGPSSPSPTGPVGPATPAPGTAQGPATGSGPSTDPSDWQIWWSLNRHAYLDLKSAMRRSLTSGGADAPVSIRPPDEIVYGRVVPAILATLERDRNPDVSTGGLLALAKIGERPGETTIEKPLSAFLSSANQEVSESSALALGLLGSPGASLALAHLLEARDPGRKLVDRPEVAERTRAFAAYGLGLWAERQTLPDMRRYAVHNLARFESSGPARMRDVPVACLTALGLAPLDRRAGAVVGAESASANADAQAEFLRGVLLDDSQDEHVRAYAPVPLARVVSHATAEQRDAVVEFLVSIAETRSNEAPAVRQSALTALGILVTNADLPLERRARSLLERAGQQGDRLSRRLAWIALGRAGGRPMPGHASELGATAARNHLASWLKRGSTAERPWAALALGLLEREASLAGGRASSGIVEALVSALREHSSPAESGAYCIALGLARAHTVDDVLLAELARPDDVTRGHAAVALGLVGAARAVEPLRAIASGARFRPGLLRDTSVGLGLLGDKSIALELVAQLKDARGLAAHAAIASALSWVGDERAVEPLLALLAAPSTSSGARAFAIVALGAICDRDDLPWNGRIAADVNYWLPPATLIDPGTGTGILDLF